MMLVSNRSNRRERFLLIIFIVSAVRPMISRPPIPASLPRRMLPPRCTPPASTRGLALRRAPRFRASPRLHQYPLSSPSALHWAFADFENLNVGVDRRTLYQAGLDRLAALLGSAHPLIRR